MANARLKISRDNLQAAGIEIHFIIVNIRLTYG